MGCLKSTFLSSHLTSEAVSCVLQWNSRRWTMCQLSALAWGQDRCVCYSLEPSPTITKHTHTHTETASSAACPKFLWGQDRCVCFSVEPASAIPKHSHTHRHHQHAALVFRYCGDWSVWLCLSEYTPTHTLVSRLQWRPHWSNLITSPVLN